MQSFVLLVLALYTWLPLRLMSSLWGYVNEMELPVFCRRPLIGLYVWAFGCNVAEALEEDLRNYRNLGEFFRRRLKPGVRQSDPAALVVSPSDGRVLHCGRVRDGKIEQVKGVSYSLKAFLGPNTWTSAPDDHHGVSDMEYKQKLMRDQNSELYSCIVYLAPGDYHRFHSASDWRCSFRRHFAGQLFSVSPAVARWIKDLFVLNERALYVGSWRHGFFSYCAVGATNVGSIRVYCDDDLETNKKRGFKRFKPHMNDKSLSLSKDLGCSFSKGDAFGEFNLGSTVVLVFEAPKDFKFSVQPGDRVQCGQSLGKVGWTRLEG